jgi:hypothetical protein
MLSDQSKAALAACFATKGKHKGQLLAKCPRSNTLEAAAWQATMLCVNPFRASIGAVIFMTAEQRIVWNEVMTFIESLPKETQVALERNRQALEQWGVW